MTLTLTASLLDGRATIQSGTTTVANSSATTSITELPTASIGDFQIDTGFVSVTGIATAVTDAIILADACRVMIMDPNAATVMEIIGLPKWYKEGTDRVSAFFECLSRRPILPVNGSIRIVFRSPDSNATATGVFQITLMGRRLRIS